MISSSTNRDRGSSEALLTEEEFARRLSAPDPRMAGLSISNDALRNSLPVAPPWSLRKWIDSHTGGSLRKLQNLQLDGVDWLVARKPWQRWTLSLGLGAMIGLGIVFSGAKFFRGGLQSASAVASALPTAEVVAAVRPAPSAAPSLAAGAPAPSFEPVAAPAVDAPVATAVASAPVVAEEPPSAAPEPVDDDSSADAAPEKPGKHKKKGKRSRSRHQKAQSEANPLKQAAAAAAFKLAQPATSKSKRSKRTKATASF